VGALQSQTRTKGGIRVMAKKGGKGGKGGKKKGGKKR
jgi:hypothetical protein